MYIYNNTVTDAVISNAQSSTMVIKNNNATGATIKNTSSSSAVITGNIADSANISNTDSSSLYLYYNNADKVNIFNSNSSSITALGNEISNSVIQNDSTSTLTVGDCIVADGCQADADRTTSITDSTVANYGTLNVSGTIDATGSTITNSGNAYLDAVTLSGGTIYNEGTLTALSSSTVGSLINAGSIVLNPTSTSAGTVLTVDGDYVGSNGILSLGTVLGSDDSLTDKLVITGSATGTTYVTVANENGTGAQTREGIEVISTGSSTDDAFVQSGRIVAGAYEYHLQKGNASQSADSLSNWYLTSYVTESASSEATTTVSSGSSSDTTSTGTTVTAVRAYRPEAASYTSNLQAVNTLFMLRLHDRLGDVTYVDPVTGEKKVTSMWVRNEGGRNAFSMNDAQNRTTANRYVLQIGGDVAQWSGNGEDNYRVGLMGGYATQHSFTRNSLTGYSSRGSVEGYSAGLYGSWLQNMDDTGAYIDSWIMYNWFNNHVQGEGLAGESYSSRGLTASAETGYTFNLYNRTSPEGVTGSLYVQPQVQVTWMGVTADDHTETNGTYVHGAGNNNIQTRLGMRLFLKGKSSMDKNTVREFKPFFETSWIYKTRQYGANMNGESDYAGGSRNIGELKAGVEGKISSDLNLAVSVGQQMGGSGYHDTQGMLTVRYAF